jgi:hypothetical protein
MTNDWILDVLADLCAFARQNDLPKLAAQIEDATLVAVAELASAEAECLAALPEGMGDAGRVYRTYGDGQIAG